MKFLVLWLSFSFSSKTWPAWRDVSKMACGVRGHTCRKQPQVKGTLLGPSSCRCRRVPSLLPYSHWKEASEIMVIYFLSHLVPQPVNMDVTMIFERVGNHT